MIEGHCAPIYSSEIERAFNRGKSAIMYITSLYVIFGRNIYEVIKKRKRYQYSEK